MEEQIRAAYSARCRCSLSPVAQRVNFGAHPQASLAAIVLNTISDIKKVSRSQALAGLSDGRIQVDFLCDCTYGAANYFLAAVKKALNGYSGDGIHRCLSAGSRDSARANE